MAAGIWQRALSLGVVAALVVACGQDGAPAAGQSAQAPAADHPGKRTYERYCHSCHAAGVAGAPLFGAAADWEPRIARGMDALLATTIAGIPPGMPPKGLCTTCDDERLSQAIEYMVAAVR